jgi:hypothetical protein
VQPKLEEVQGFGRGGGYVCCIVGDVRSKTSFYLGV